MSELQYKADEIRQGCEQCTICSVKTKSSEEDNFGYAWWKKPKQYGGSAGEHVIVKDCRTVAEMVAARNEVKEPRLREPEGLPLYRLPLRQCAPFNGESSHQGDGDTDGRIQTRPVVPEAVPLGQGCSNYAPPSVSSPSDRSV